MLVSSSIHGTVALAASAALSGLPSCISIGSIAAAAVPIQQLSGASRWWHGAHQGPALQQQQQLLPSLSLRHMAAYAQPEDVSNDVKGSPAPPSGPTADAVAAAAGGGGWARVAAAAVTGSTTSSRRRRRHAVTSSQHAASAAAGGAAAAAAGAHAQAQAMVAQLRAANHAATLTAAAARAAQSEASAAAAAVAEPAAAQSSQSAGAAVQSSSGGEVTFEQLHHLDAFDAPQHLQHHQQQQHWDQYPPSSSSSSSSSRRRRPSAALSADLATGSQPAAAAAAATASSKDPPLDVTGEGEVSWPEGELLDNIAHHWGRLQACPSAAIYTRGTSYEEFGRRYIEQLEREERARCRSMEEVAADLARSSSSSSWRSSRSGRPGTELKSMLQTWQENLTQAIAAEQELLMGGGTPGAKGPAAAAAAAGPGSRKKGGRGSGSSSGSHLLPKSRRSDRANYGPFLLLLEPQDLATITVQTVLSKVATALPPDEESDATSWSGTQAAAFGSSSGSSSSSADWEQQHQQQLGPNSGVVTAAPDDGSSRPAGSATAVSVAELLGRAVNSRYKYLKFKADQYRQAAAAGGSSGSSGSSVGLASPGDPVQQQVLSYLEAGEADVKRYQAGQERLERLQGVRGLGAAYKRAAATAEEQVRWDQATRLKVGAFLLSLLCENAYLTHDSSGRRLSTPSSAAAAAAAGGSAGTAAGTAAGAGAAAAAGAAGAGGGVPAFEYIYLRRGLRQQALVRASEEMVRLLLGDRSLGLSLLTKVPPMLVPPLPWSSYATGGQLTSRHWMMRTRYSTAMQKMLREAAANQQYQQVLDALNVLGNTAWKINPQVHATLTTLWAQKSTGGGLPCQVPLKYPTPPPTSYRLIFEGGALTARGGPWSRLEKRGHTLHRDDIRRLNRNMASLKADFLLKKQVADEFLGAPEFYYPHTLDFRGRAYPLHPSLHHLGDDMSRGLLLFARGRPLGEQGLDWLYVHLANVWGNGQDKLSFEGRRAFAREQLVTILEVASDPLRHKWWQEAEKPWQALAACCEIAGALQSGNPASFVSHLPVHMDGSCNGLQHYAALGRDEAGGRAVNLLPSDKPQDVYKGVAEIVARRAARDAAAGNAVAKRCLGLIDRKVVKQTVMTSVYGVTAIGARAQVENRLREKRADMKAKASLAQQAGGPNSSSSSSSSAGNSNDPLWPLAAAAALGSGGSNGSSNGSSGGSSALSVVQGKDEYSWMDDKDSIWQAAKYLADQTLDAIGEMFGSARAIMGWLADCAREVAADGYPVRWTSPLGLPIMQPYHKLPLTTVATTTQNFSVVRAGGDGSDVRGSKGQWIKARQRSAFPPNYIHSIDSTHMMMTALACSEAGIEFAGVHDSFWTHAGTVPAMNDLLRAKFLALHSQGLLEELVRQLQGHHPDLTFPPIPERGDLALNRVKHSHYFFS